MRVSPLGVLGARADVGAEAAAEFARVEAALTHPNPICVDANAVFVTGLVTAIRGGTAREVVDAMESATSERAAAQAIAAGRTGDVGDYDEHMGWVLLALSIAVRQLVLYDDPVEPSSTPSAWAATPIPTPRLPVPCWGRCMGRRRGRSGGSGEYSSVSRRRAVLASRIRCAASFGRRIC